MKRILIIVLCAAGFIYLLDYLSVRFRVPRRDSFGAITVHTYYVVKQKSGKTEYDYAGDQDVTCSNSLFPQMGAKPCWYVARHLQQQIVIDSGNPHNPSLF